MPGIVGFAGQPLTGRALAQTDTLLPRMADALKDEPFYQVAVEQTATFGLGRVGLGTINGKIQPVWNETRTIGLVMEGEVYGYGALKQEPGSRGPNSRKDGDAEFILRLYEEFGEEFARYLNGAFALAIWNETERTLVLANDHLGLYPLYYTERNGRLTFASGVRALLADPELPADVDPLAVAQLLHFEYVLDTRTLLAGVHLLPPASVLTFRDGRLSIRSYWNLEFCDFSEPLGEAFYLDALVHHLSQAVARQASDDRRPGLLLSGGLDSRIVLALLVQMPTLDALHTFTFGTPRCDDARIAGELAAAAGAQHQFFELKADYLLQVVEKGVRLTDGLESCVHMHALAYAHAQAEYTNVIYKGFMGDALLGSHLSRELWAGYDDDTLSRRLFRDANLCGPEEQKRLFTREFRSLLAEDAVFTSFRALLDESKAKLAANKQNHFDLRQRQRRFILNGVQLVRSQATVRLPFADKELVEFVLTIPPGLRLDRWLMIKALIRLSPELARIPYQGTGMPLVECARDLRIRLERQIRWRLRAAGLKWVAAPQKRSCADYNGWMRTVLREWVEETLLSRRSRERGCFNPQVVRTLVAEQMAGANHARKLGVLLSLELWQQQFLDGRATPGG
jgi:asparagine synthase (glutamine-hydrolysing)